MRAYSSIKRTAAGLFISVLTLLLGCLLTTSKLGAEELSFAQPSNWGGSGLMEIPNARVMGAGDFRVGISYVDPFITYYGTLGGFFPGLELNGRVTQLEGVKSGLEGQSTFKDKAADIKFQILDQRKYIPAIAVGFNDIQGTQLLKAEYLVADWQIYPFNLTFGYGRNRFDGPFGGIACELTDRITLMAEYSPVKFENDTGAIGRALGKKAESQINVGGRFQLFKGVELGVSWQRGEQLGAMAQVTYPLGSNLLPWKPDPPYYAPVDRRPLRERHGEVVAATIRERLEDQGFFNVDVFLRPGEISVQYENGRYLSETKAIGRVLRTVVALSPAEVEKINLYAKRRNLPLLEFSVKNEVALAYFNGKIDEETLAEAVRISNRGFNLKEDKNVYHTEIERFADRAHLDYSIKPGAYVFLNDPTEFFQFQLSIDPWAKLLWWDGFAAYAELNIPIYTNIESSNQPGEPPIRSDIVDYVGTSDPSFTRLLGDQVLRLGDRTFGRATIGYQDVQYFAVGGEILHVFGDGTFAAGVSADWDQKRDPDTPLFLGFRELDTYTLQGNFYYTIPKLGLTTQLYGGRFMAGDEGAGVRVTREFKTGAQVVFWYTYTDTSDFTDFNKDYEEKGIALILPARVFEKVDSRVRYTYPIVPWTRDVGQLIHYWNTLGDFISGLYPNYIKARLGDLKK